MTWRDMAGGKLMTPEEAVSVIRRTDKVMVAPIVVTPFTLCRALFERRNELRGMHLDHFAPFFPWKGPGEELMVELHDVYASGVDRDWVNSGEVHYHPNGRWMQDEIPPGVLQEPDVFMVAVSPPDRHGYCSFGSGVFFSPRMCRIAKTVIAEVHEDFIRTGGENYVHISQLDRICEAERSTGTLPAASLSEEESLSAEVICTLVAAELVNDRDTVQIGIGSVSSLMGLFLGDKNDLGMQAELITTGIPELVDRGVINGKYKTMHAGKVVASFLIVPPEEMGRIDGHPAFELYDFAYVDDVRMLVRHDNLVAINNALQVDLTGQVASEGIGSRVWAGVGGQTAFAIAANYSKGGRSITVLPSSSMVDGQRMSRIVPALPEGGVVTVPRTFVDYVVTEHGIAHLRGKVHRSTGGRANQHRPSRLQGGTQVECAAAVQHRRLTGFRCRKDIGGAGTRLRMDDCRAAGG